MSSADRDWYFNNCEGVPAVNISYMGYTVRRYIYIHKDPCRELRKESLLFMGHTVRSNTHRLTEWYKWDGSTCSPLFDQVHGTELYDHSTQVPFPLDFDATENVNVADVAANAAILKAHRALLLGHFKKGQQHAGCPAVHKDPFPPKPRVVHSL